MTKLLHLVEEEKIKIEYTKLLPKNYFGLYTFFDEPIISINSIIKSDYKLHRCILAEELGHHFTSVGQSIYPVANFPFWEDYQGKQELKALKWSSNFLIPYKEVMHVIQVKHA